MNVFFDSNYSSQSSVPTDPTFNSVTSNDFIIPASNPGDVLFIGPEKQIDGLAIGPNKYVLESNGSQPAWTNTLDINSIKSVQYTIPGTFHGDLFTVDASNNLERVPIGTAGNILTSTGTEFAWQALDLPNPLNIQNLTLTNGTLTLTNSVISDPNKQYIFGAGAGANINPAGTTPFSGSINVVLNRQYKVHFWGKLITATPVSLTLYMNSVTISSITIAATGPASFVLIYIAPVTGSIPIEITGIVSSGDASLIESWFTIETW